MLKPIEIQKAIDISDYKTILSLCLAGKQIRIGIHRLIMKVSICWLYRGRFFYKAVGRSFYRSTITRMKKSLFHYCVIDKKDLVLAEILLRFGADPSQDRS